MEDRTLRKTIGKQKGVNETAGTGFFLMCVYICVYRNREEKLW